MKRQFKHIQSQDVVEEVLAATGYYQSVKVPMANPVSAKYIENTNDWVEIIKPEYTILSFIAKYNNSAHTLRENGEYTFLHANQQLCHNRSLEHCLDVKNGFKIHSVRRESDSEIFTIGDNTDKGIITRFEINDLSISGITVYFDRCTMDYNNHCLSSLKKVEIKQWEIISLSSPHGPIPIVGEYQISHCFKNPGYKITVVKRLSDGVEFKIGDKVKLNCNKDSVVKTITKIAIENVGMCAKKLYIYTMGEQSTINNYMKVEKLFTTEDNVDKYLSDEVLEVRQDFSLSISLIYKYGENGSQFTAYPNWKFFHSKQKAEEYILMNKPCLSIMDIINKSYEGISNGWSGIGMPMVSLNNMKELVKSKL